MLVIYFYTRYPVILVVISKQYAGHLLPIYLLLVIHILFMDHYSRYISTVP